MKKSLFTSLALLLILVTTGCLILSKTTDKNPDLGVELASSICDADSTWFSGVVPEPDYQNFTDSPNNCDFHQISWQYFLWLTEGVDGDKLRFETLFNDHAINPATKDPKSHILGGIVQAGGPAGVLIDQDGRAVYTTMMINDIYRNFVIDNKLYDADALKAVSSTLDFPKGAFSLKASWKVVETGEDVSDFYTTEADVYLLKNENGKVVLSDKTKKEKVALVGFHIAVVINNHPEFIWATFEHIKNAPNFNADGNMNAPVSDKNFTFYKAGTSAQDCNNFNGTRVKLNEQTQQLSPVSQIFRQYKNGGGSANNIANINALNKSVHQQLPDNSIWQNYIEVGAVWFGGNNKLSPNWTPNNDPDSLIVGSLKLSNAVIESFTQNIRSENECFSCHNTLAVTNTINPKLAIEGKNVLTSHILLQNYLNLISPDERIDRSK